MYLDINTTTAARPCREILRQADRTRALRSYVSSFWLRPPVRNCTFVMSSCRVLALRASRERRSARCRPRPPERSVDDPALGNPGGCVQPRFAAVTGQRAVRDLDDEQRGGGVRVVVVARRDDRRVGLGLRVVRLHRARALPAEILVRRVVVAHRRLVELLGVYVLALICIELGRYCSSFCAMLG